MPPLKQSQLDTGTPVGTATLTGLLGGTNINLLLDEIAAYLNERYQIFDVRDYGAVCDGTTIDTAAIQAAIDAAEAYVAANGSGAEVVLHGKMRVDNTITVQSDMITLRGQGAGNDLFAAYGACLIPTEDFPNDSYVLAFSLGVQTRTWHGNVCERIGVAVENGETLTNTVHGILWQAHKGLLSGVKIDNMTGRGLGIQGFDTSWKTTYSIFQNCHFRRSGTHGVEMLGSSADMFFTNCVFDGNENGAGLYNPGAGNIYALCHFTGNLNNIRFAGGASEVVILGCMLETPRQHNIYIDVTTGSVTSLRIIANRFDSNALTSDNLYDSVAILRDSGGNTCSADISHNSFSSSGANDPRYHVNLSGGAALACIVNDNTYSTTGSGAVNHHANAVRCLINGLGRNAGDPASTGDWFGQGVDGNRVWNSVGSAFHTKADGTWRAG